MSPSTRARVTALAVLVLGGLAAPASADDAELPLVTGSLEWGFKSSFRNYVGGMWNSQPAGRRITVLPPAEFDLDATPALPSSTATPNETLPYVFPLASGSAAGADDLSVQTAGGVRYSNPGHGFDVTIADLRLVSDGGAAYLLGDAHMVVHSAFGEYEEGDYVGEDVRIAEIAELDVELDDGELRVAGTGLTVAAEAAAFLPQSAGDALDDFVLTAATWAPRITVSKSEGLNPDGTETIVVTGSGFDPQANIGTRAPTGAGNPSGIYVVFGRFTSPWRPSEGAPTSARAVIDQKWPLPEPVYSGLAGSNPQYALLEDDGSFTVTLRARRDESVEGDYGVYTFAAGGAPANPAHELFVPVSFGKADATVDVEIAEPVALGRSSTATVEVQGIDDYPAPTGEVTVTVDGVAVASAVLDGERIAVPLPSWSRAATSRVVAEYSGDAAYRPASGAATLTVAKARPSVALTVRSKVTYASRPTATVKVTAPKGVTPGGKVTVKAGSTVVGTGTVKNGTASVTLGTALKPGTKKLVAEYAGNANLAAASSTAVTVKVAKATPKVTLTVPKTVKASTKAKVKVKVTATGTKPAGKVKLVLTKGSAKVKTITVKVRSGKTSTVRLPKLKKGTYRLKATYTGSSTVATKASTKHTLKVR